MSKFKRGLRLLRIEPLGQRNVLSAIPIMPNVAVAAAGEGEEATVDRQDQTVTVIGSDNDDTILVELGESVHRLVVNGDSTEYDVSEVSEFVIRGDGGNDTVTLQGTDQNERVDIADGALDFMSDSYSVEVSLVEDITVNAQGGFRSSCDF